MKVSIMQPHLFMWPGLLKSIIQSDLHVVLDSVTASKNERYNRNKICGNDSERWLTVPFSNFSRHLTIDKLNLDASSEKVLSLENLFSSRYSEAPFLCESLNLVSGLKNSKSCGLCDVYIAFLDTLSALGFNISPIILSSQLSQANNSLFSGSHGASLVDRILQAVNATTYLAAQNVQTYSSREAYSVDNVLFQRFTPLPYQQYCKGRKDVEFVPFLSVLDTVASIGVERTIAYMDSCNEWT